nr:hypothetical protein [uncultured Psychroserpens sp.]
MKYIIILLMLAFSATMNAQEVQKDGKTYEVKVDKIFLDGKDVTETLSIEKTASILESARLINEKVVLKEAAEKLKKAKQKEIADAEKTKQKEADKVEKEAKKLVKDKKKAEKAQKRAEKALKKQQKAQDKFKKASKKLEDAQKKYKKLKRKGKLSPSDDLKWLEKLKDLKEDIEKAKSKL